MCRAKGLSQGRNEGGGGPRELAFLAWGTECGLYGRGPQIPAQIGEQRRHGFTFHSEVCFFICKAKPRRHFGWLVEGEIMGLGVESGFGGLAALPARNLPPFPELSVFAL